MLLLPVIQPSGANYVVNNLNQYLSDGTSGGAITLGSEHELLNYQNISYTYINDTHLSSVSGMDVYGGQSTYQLSYDALGRCVARILNGSTAYYIYDGKRPVLDMREPIASKVPAIPSA
jgi:hypothetical protein